MDHSVRAFCEARKKGSLGEKLKSSFLSPLHTLPIVREMGVLFSLLLSKSDSNGVDTATPPIPKLKRCTGIGGWVKTLLKSFKSYEWAVTLYLHSCYTAQLMCIPSKMYPHSRLHDTGINLTLWYFCFLPYRLQYKSIKEVSLDNLNNSVEAVQLIFYKEGSPWWQPLSGRKNTERQGCI